MSNKVKITIGIVIILLIGAAFVFSTNSSLFRGALTEAAEKVNLSISPNLTAKSVILGQTNIPIGKWILKANKDVEIKSLGFDIGGGLGKNAYKYFSGVIKLKEDETGNTIYSTTLQPEHSDGACSRYSLSKFSKISKDDSKTITLYADLKSSFPDPTATPTLEIANFQATLCSDITQPTSATGPLTSIVNKENYLSVAPANISNIKPGATSVSIGNFKITTNVGDTEIKQLGLDIGGSLGKNSYQYLTGIAKLVDQQSGETLYSTIVKSIHSDGICTPVNLAKVLKLQGESSKSVSLLIDLKPTAPVGSSFKATLCSSATSPSFAIAPAVTIAPVPSCDNC